MVVDQGDGLRTTYANLAAKPTVKEGDTVRTGDILGAVGDTAIAESGLAPHLHLETRMDGQPVDPMSYLDRIKKRPLHGRTSVRAAVFLCDLQLFS